MINCSSIMPTQAKSFFPVQQHILGQQSSEWIQWPVRKACKLYQVITFKSVWQFVNQSLTIEKREIDTGSHCKRQTCQLCWFTLQLPNVGLYFLFFFFTIINLLYDQISRPILYNLHIWSILIFTQVPSGILISICWGHKMLFSFQINGEAVYANFSKALITESVAPGSLLYHLTCQISHMAFAFSAD